MLSWRFTAVSVSGTSHLRHRLPCQDYSLCELHGNTLICAVADGAGTASHAETGARIAATYFVQAFHDVDPAAIEREHASGFIQSLQQMLCNEAADNGAALTDYACTLLGVIATPEVTVCVQIGDGAIVIPGCEPGTYDTAVWPMHGEYANTTSFVTQKNAADVVELRIVPPVTELALFSDGLERLILDETTRSVHAPALRPIFDWFHTAEAADAAERSRALTAYLDSDHINHRTDDDKSLVVAILAAD
jgi:hypothetical protein